MIFRFKRISLWFRNCKYFHLWRIWCKPILYFLKSSLGLGHGISKLSIEKNTAFLKFSTWQSKKNLDEKSITLFFIVNFVYSLLLTDFAYYFVVSIVDSEQVNAGWVNSYQSQKMFTCSKSTIGTLEKTCKIRLKLTVKTPERRHWRRTGVIFVNFEYISHCFLELLLWNLSK